MQMYNSQISNIRELLSELKVKKESNSEKTIEQRYQDIKNKLNNSSEELQGECSRGKNEFKAGILDEDDLINEENLTAEENTSKGFFSSKLKLTKEFKDKIIVGWKLKSFYKDGEGGKWKINSQLLGQSCYSFSFSPGLIDSCDWKLRIWTIEPKKHNMEKLFNGLKQ